MNHDTVDFVFNHLPGMVCDALDSHCQTSIPSPAAISEILTQAIVSIEASILSDFQTLFPDGGEALLHADTRHLRTLINDSESAHANYAKVNRVVGGSTILITLFNEDTGELWMANLGDSCAGKCRTVRLQNTSSRYT